MKGGCLRHWPSRETRQTLSEFLTIYGFWIGMALSVVAILLFFDIAKTVIVDEPQDERPVISDIGVKIIWERNYEPPKEIEEALQKLLMGEAYEQPVWDYEWHEFYFPQSVDDFPSFPRPHGPAEAIFLRWRIGAVPPLPSDETPTEMRLPLSGETWQWNIDPRVLLHIRGSEGWHSTEAAWYKIAIAMIGGYSTLDNLGPSADTRKAAIDAFRGAEWTFEAKYKVWNSSSVPTKDAKITLGCGPTHIVAPEGIDPNAFIIRPGPSNALEFTLIPESGYKTLEDAHNEADCVRENTRLDVTVSEAKRVTRGPAWAWIGGAVVFGILAATATMKLCWFQDRRRQSTLSGREPLRNEEAEKEVKK